MSAFVIDAFEFCRNSGLREGVTPVADMPRLAADCADKSGEIRWSIQGGQTRQADQIEEILDDESIDVIVGSHACDVRELLEDEALLALPQAPKHDVCPDTKLLDSLKTEKVSPFAGLKNLKSE